MASNFQKKVIKEYEDNGYLVLKHIRLNKSAYPDLQCIKKDCPDIWIECKEGKDTLKPLQKFRIDELNKLGKIAFCLHDKKGIIYPPNPKLRRIKKKCSMKQNKKHRFPYKWKISETKFTKDKGTVFSCFACGGGSSFGYKLAGFDVIGHNDIDKKMIEVYKLNHNPKYSFLESITTFSKRKDLPKELYELDILDGSPPCSSFSMAGNREKDWGKEKIFREGQELQVLDTLFFDFIDLAKELQPKVVVAENVKGLLLGEAKEYVIKIYKEFDKAGYYVQHFLLNASKMGVPQRRERVFFIALRKDLAKPFLYYVDMFTELPKIDMEFNEPEIKYSEFADYSGPPITEYAKKAWDVRSEKDKNISDSKKRVPGMKVSDMNTAYVFDDKVCQTLTARGNCGSLLFSKPIRLSKQEFCNIGTFPQDYNFTCNFGYLIGMSVPPVMTAQIATEIYNQWLSKL